MSETKQQTVKKPDLSWRDSTDNDIVEHLIVKKGVPIGEDGEVTIQEEYIETKRYNRQEYINSFRDDVGVLNMLKKCNAGLLNPATLACSFDKNLPINDISDVPTDVGDALQLVDDARKLYASLPAALKAGMDFNTFCATFDQKKFDAYIAAEKAKAVEAQKGEGK